MNASTINKHPYSKKRSCITHEKVCVRSVILFKKGVKDVRNINDTFVRKVLTERICQKLADKPQSGRSSQIDIDVQKQMVEVNPCQTYQNILRIIRTIKTLTKQLYWIIYTS